MYWFEIISHHQSKPTQYLQIKHKCDLFKMNTLISLFCLLENLGCFDNVLAFLDVLCSGKTSCKYVVGNEGLFEYQPCGRQLVSYLDIDYECIPGTINLAIVKFRSIKISDILLKSFLMLKKFVTIKNIFNQLQLWHSHQEENARTSPIMLKTRMDI